MLYTTDRNTIMGLDGRAKSLQTPLVRSPGRPQGGWRATIPVKGQQITVPGVNPVDVYNHTVVLLARNGLQVPARDIWLNLNIQWLQRTPEKYHAVPLGDLLLISREYKDEPTDKRKRSYKPSDWGSIGWKWMGLWLAKDSYNFRDFLLQTSFVLDMLNPNTNDSLGCAECYREFAKAVDELKKRPETDLEGARKWLVDFHNAVNYRLQKKVVSYAEAAKMNFWV